MNHLFSDHAIHPESASVFAELARQSLAVHFPREEALRAAQAVREVRAEIAREIAAMSRTYVAQRMNQITWPVGMAARAAAPTKWQRKT